MGEGRESAGKFTESVEFDGHRYYRHPLSAHRWAREYFIRVKDHKALHEAVWEKEHGPKPEGCEIHHKDGNSFNNAPENLVCLTRDEHIRAHAELGTRRNSRRGDNPVVCDVCGAVFEGNNGVRPYRVCSGRCLARARQIASRFFGYAVLEGAGKELTGDGGCVCENCGKSFASGRKGTRFCCQKCRDAWAWKNGLTAVQKKGYRTVTCAVCGKEFVTRGRNTRCCSQVCVNYFRWHKDRV